MKIFFKNCKIYFFLLEYEKLIVPFFFHKNGHLTLQPTGFQKLNKKMFLKQVDQ